MTKKNSYKVIALYFCLGLLAYFNAIPHPFVHDDVVFIQNNPQIQQWNLVETFFKYQTPVPGSSIVNAYWRPVLDLLNKFQFFFFGLNSHGYHAFNVFLHILNSFLVFYLLRILIGKEKIAFTVGLLFLLHPVQTEAVSCISGISNLVFSFFCLISFIFYLRSEVSSSTTLYFFSLLFFFTGLLSKEQTAILPVLILIYEWSKKRFSNFKIPGKTVGMFLILAIYFILRKIVTAHSVTGLGEKHELVLRALHIPHTLLNNIRIILWPSDLHYYRSLDILSPYLGPMMGFILVCLIITILIFKLPKENFAWAIFGVGWFLVALLPTLNIIPLINEYSFILNAEHFLYFPLVGFLLVLVFVCQQGGNHFFREKAERILKGLLIAVCMFFIVLCIRQNTFWRSEVALFERMILFEKDFGRGHLLLAKAYYAERRYENSVGEYKQALQIMQTYADQTVNSASKKIYENFIAEIYFDLAHCYEALRKPNLAIEMYQKAIQLDPENAVFYNNLGSVYLMQENLVTAETNFKQAIHFAPDDPLSKNNLAICLIKQNRPEEARTLWENILKQYPDFIAARDNLRRLLRSGNQN